MAKPCPLCNHPETKDERKLAGHQLVGCLQCGFVYADLELESISSANHAFDDDNAEWYSTNQTMIDVGWMDRVVRSSGTGNTKGRVLDVGCGNCLLLERFERAGWEPHGIDPSPWGQKAAEDHGYPFHRGTLEDCPWAEGYFDAAVSLSTLEHVERPGDFLNQLSRLVRPGGTLYVAGMPNYHSLTIRLGLSSFNSNMPPLHVSYLTPQTLRTAARQAALDKIEVCSYGIPDIFPLYWRVVQMLRKDKRSPSTSTDQAASEQQPPVERPLLNQSPPLWARLAVAAFYHLRLPGLGSSLAVRGIVSESR